MLSKRDLASVQKQLVHYDEAREAVLTLSRTATRLAGSSILEIHRGDMEAASNTLRKVEQTLSKIEILANDFSEFKTSSGVVVAFQEYVEAMTLRSFAQSERIPTISELKTDNRSYVLGPLDAVGEFRRMALNCLRRGEVGKAEKLLGAMEGVYDDLQTLEHTSIIPTFRVKMDADRRFIESTRDDVVNAVSNQYVPGFLGFREGPLLVKIAEKIRQKPDVFLIDGQGVAHPRRFGLACHVGLALDRPTIGVAKSRLYGRSEDSKILDLEGEVIGRILTAQNRKFYVSVGHRISLETASDLVEKSLVNGHPSPLRQAHLESNRAKQGGSD